MSRYSHNFVETQDGFHSFGWDRERDEATVISYLQMFSDDQLMQILRHRLTDRDLEEIYFLINRLLKTRLTEDEYHRLFLKEAYSEQVY